MKWSSPRRRVLCVIILCSVLASLSVPIAVSLAGSSGDVVPAPEIRQEVVWERIDVPPRLVTLSRELGMPIADLQVLSDRDIWNLIIDNACNLGVNVYVHPDELAAYVDPSEVDELKEQAGKDGVPGMVLIARGRPEQTSQEEIAPVQQTAADADSDVETFASVNAIQQRIDWMYNYLEKMYVDNPYNDRAYIHEYPGFPCGIYSWLKSEWRYAGSFNTSDFWYPPPLSGNRGVSKNHATAISTYYCFMDVSYEDGGDFDFHEPYVWQDREFPVWEQKTIYTVSIRHYYGVNAVSFYCGDSCIHGWIDCNTPMPITWSTTTYNFGTLPSSRYTIRHCVQTGEKAFRINWAHNFGHYLRVLRDAYGFTYDICDPLYGITYDNDGFMFDHQAYRDVHNGVWNILDGYPSINDPHRYPYYSKVGNPIGQTLPYREASASDKGLCPTLCAIHGMVKYNNPDVQITTAFWSGRPRELARELESNWWNGHGIRALGKDPNVASGVRTASFLVLESLLGYKYGDNTSRYFADLAADVLMRAQWGRPPYWDGWGETVDSGSIYRPGLTGGVLEAWQPGTNGYWPGCFRTPTNVKSFFDYVFDIPITCSMGEEDWDESALKTEATPIAMQALRTYLYWKYGVIYPSPFGEVIYIPGL